MTLLVTRELLAAFDNPLTVRCALHMTSLRQLISPLSRSMLLRERSKISEYKKAGANITPALGY